MTNHHYKSAVGVALTKIKIPKTPEERERWRKLAKKMLKALAKLDNKKEKK